MALLPIGAFVCATLFARQAPAPPSSGQTLSPDQLEGLVAPLALYPDPLLITWATDLGNAFLNQQGDVMATVQRMRQKAQQGGKLASSRRMTQFNPDKSWRPVVLE